MLVIGVVIGAFLSAYLSGTLSFVVVPAMFGAAFGPSPALRLAVALLGGVLAGLGARWAGGCTSGHGISGTLQLAFSSLGGGNLFLCRRDPCGRTAVRL